VNRCPYLRAYMAGVTLPAAFLLIALTIFYIARFVYQIPLPIERTIVFPMALVPNVFGAWNILYVALRRRYLWNIGIHGALLPLLIGPAGCLVARWLGILETTHSGFVYFQAVHIPFTRTLVIFPAVVAGYYLVWKYVVGFFNRVLDLP
jgi:hypothetical protein